MKHTAIFFLYFLSILSCGCSYTESPAICSVYFSPDDKLADRLVQLIEEEKSTLYVAVYCLTHHKVTDALIEAKGRGVDVQIIIDPYSLDLTKNIERLAKAHIPIYVWDPCHCEKPRGDKRALMHDKFCVFSDQVWTGSFNFTHKATAFNEENAILIKSESMVKEFAARFLHIQQQGCLSYKKYKKLH